MYETIEAAIYQGRVLCAFPTREECKQYLRIHQELYGEIGPFEVTLKTQYITSTLPGRNDYCFDR